MAKTRTDLVYRALRNLGVLPQGQDPSAEEYNSVEALIDPMIEDLQARDIVFIEDADAIEDKYFVHLGHMLAGHALSEFGMQNDAGLTARGIKAEEELGDIDRSSIRYIHSRTMRTDFPLRTICASTT
jgi:hypothetical protein